MSNGHHHSEINFLIPNQRHSTDNGKAILQKKLKYMKMQNTVIQIDGVVKLETGSLTQQFGLIRKWYMKVNDTEAIEAKKYPKKSVNRTTTLTTWGSNILQYLVDFNMT